MSPSSIVKARRSSYFSPPTNKRVAFSFDTPSAVSVDDESQSQSQSTSSGAPSSHQPTLHVVSGNGTPPVEVDKGQVEEEITASHHPSVNESDDDEDDASYNTTHDDSPADSSIMDQGPSSEDRVVGTTASDAKAKERTRSTTTTQTKKKKLIHLTKQKPTVKSIMFMNSPTSIYAAVTKYHSLVQGLHGSEDVLSYNYNTKTADGHGATNADGFPRVDRRVDNMETDIESALVLINIHFGACPMFEQEFDDILSYHTSGNNNHTDYEDEDEGSTNNRGSITSGNGSGLTLEVIEEAFHRSVRHLCPCECFLRAYYSVREFTFLWRDLIIQEEGSTDSSATAGSSPSRKRRFTKETLLSGWTCQLLPRPPSKKKAREEEDEDDDATSNRKLVKRPSPLVYVSPNETEFATKTKAINYMNKKIVHNSTASMQPQSIHLQQRTTNANMSKAATSTTLLIQTTTKINPIYSPFGLLEELFIHDPWKLLVSTICLNVTTRPQVDKVLYQFLQHWPDAETTANVNLESNNWQDITDIISPLGLGIKRAKGLIRFSQEYLALTEEYDAFNLTEKQVKGLFQIGQYGWTAYKVFILRELPSSEDGGSIKVCDHALQLYVEYQLGMESERGQTTLNDYSRKRGPASNYHRLRPPGAYYASPPRRQRLLKEYNDH